MLDWDKFDAVKKQVGKNGTGEDIIRLGLMSEKELMPYLRSVLNRKSIKNDNSSSGFFMGYILGLFG